MGCNIISLSLFFGVSFISGPSFPLKIDEVRYVLCIATLSDQLSIERTKKNGLYNTASTVCDKGN